MKQRQTIAIWIWLSVRNIDCRFRSDTQGRATHVSVDVMDVLTDRSTVRITFFLNTFTELFVCMNLYEKWLQFPRALVGQTRGPVANFIELGVIQLTCCANRARIIRFTNPGKRKMG